MCDLNLCNELENGGGGSMQKQSLALSKIMQAQDAQGKTMETMAKRLANLPDRTEVREMIKEGLSIHIDSCDAARDGKPSPVEEFVFGKGGLTMKGRTSLLVGLALGGGVVWFLVKAIPNIEAWLKLWMAR